MKRTRNACVESIVRMLSDSDRSSLNYCLCVIGKSPVHQIAVLGDSCAEHACVFRLSWGYTHYCSNPEVMNTLHVSSPGSSAGDGSFVQIASRPRQPSLELAMDGL